MSSSINQITNNGSSNGQPASQSNTSVSEGQFLQLLTTQLQNQDPLNPMDDTQSVAELAQFSSLQSMDSLSSSFSAFQSNFAVMQSAGLLGKEVSAVSTDGSGNQTTVQGTVASINVVNGVPEITLMGSNGSLVSDSSGNPLVLPTSAILSIGGSSGSGSGSGSGS
ncbi:MAG TPA: flagellar hook capping FlgD N-terminal domain-containing protein [Candidatus Limnocylindria bacterium]|jgi:flagellar basal-body rod modification protein FlgD|nr:flagellar hook capping FlgD N-terminal domain-containing protein [Candidatus Limnocylindria bacterium]